MRAWEGLVGYDAADEGLGGCSVKVLNLGDLCIYLEELRAEQCSVAGWRVSYRAV